MDKFHALLVGISVIGVISGLYYGAYYADPILSSVIDSQNSRIDGLLDQNSQCKGQNELLSLSITNLTKSNKELWEANEELNKCFVKYKSDNMTIYDAYELLECVE